ncbi:uncharacterized protein BCR38DRAFT_484216 [Pseudomassariella vexata]|uniref:Uncharacterized protein n=1 Tax=Pseudomassariella vexata TaxID=1141098 RepID=A0A1Y2E4W9_9PEZI|nr:uncharacterized protein BCR38DRAFT_484216 [Pseudomassariella vexata]ORY66600.1 hypothetical protein BCR38DRAFT_484216 [Pseudomassariella vexata]
MRLALSIAGASFPSYFAYGFPALSSQKIPRDISIHRHYHRNDNGTQIFCHNETQSPIFTLGDLDYGAPGVILVNYDSGSHDKINGTMYFFYESDHDYVPYKYTILSPWSHAYINLCPTFEGRIVRGNYLNLDGRTHNLGTWAEVNWHPDGSAWGDVSLLQGNDGAVVIQSLDGINKMKGFAVDLLASAPEGAWARKDTGSWCLDKIVGPNANKITKSWEAKYLDPWNVYLEGDIDPVINSNNGRFQVTFYEGVI